MAAYTAWLPEVMPEVSDCPEPMAVNAIRNACIEFCTQTLYWQDDLAALALETADLPYTLVVPAGSSVAQIMSVVLLGVPLVSTTLDELNSRVLGWRDTTGQPRAYFQPQPGVIDFYPRPEGTTEYTFLIRVAFTPTRASTTVSDLIYEDYLEDIAAGALSRLLAVPNRPWTNTEAAKYYDGVFNSAKVDGAVQASKQYGRNTQQVQMRSF